MRNLTETSIQEHQLKAQTQWKTRVAQWFNNKRISTIYHDVFQAHTQIQDDLELLRSQVKPVRTPLQIIQTKKATHHDKNLIFNHYLYNQGYDHESVLLKNTENGNWTTTTFIEIPYGKTRVFRREADKYYRENRNTVIPMHQLPWLIEDRNTYKIIADVTQSNYIGDIYSLVRAGYFEIEHRDNKRDLITQSDTARYYPLNNS